MRRKKHYWLAFGNPSLLRLGNISRGINAPKCEIENLRASSHFQLSPFAPSVCDRCCTRLNRGVSSLTQYREFNEVKEFREVSEKH